MTRQEFEERTGCKLTEEAYAPIEEMYMAAGEMGKDEFCQQWIQHGDSPLVLELMNTLRNDLTQYKACVNKHRTLQEKFEQAADLLVTAADDYDDLNIECRACEIFGHATIIKHKALHNIRLNADDAEYLKNHLD